MKSSRENSRKVVKLYYLKMLLLNSHKDWTISKTNFLGFPITARKQQKQTISDNLPHTEFPKKHKFQCFWSASLICCLNYNENSLRKQIKKFLKFFFCFRWQLSHKESAQPFDCSLIVFLGWPLRESELIRNIINSSFIFIEVLDVSFLVSMKFSGSAHKMLFKGER